MLKMDITCPSFFNKNCIPIGNPKTFQSYTWLGSFSFLFISITQKLKVGTM